MLNLPSIGDIVLDPSEKFADLDGKDKYDLLLCDGSEVNEGTHPVLWDKLLLDPMEEFLLFSDKSKQEVLMQSLYECRFYAARRTIDDDYRYTGDPNYATRYTKVVANPHDFIMGGAWTNYLLPALSLRSINSSLVNSGVILACASGYASSSEEAVNEIQLIKAGITVRYIRLRYVSRFGYVSTSLDGVVWEELLSAGTLPSDLYNAQCKVKIDNSGNAELLLNGVRGLFLFEEWDSAKYQSFAESISNGTYVPLTTYLAEYVGPPPPKEVPDMTSPDPIIPYRVVADLTGGT